MAVSAQLLVEELEIFGLECEEALVEKLIELCVLYGQNEEGMAGELIAFCTSTRKDCLTSETLNSFEHEGSQKRAITTPETPLTKRSVAYSRSPHQLLSPSSFSPRSRMSNPIKLIRFIKCEARLTFLQISIFKSATPSQKYSSRSNRGEVVTSFGSAQVMSWSGREGASNISVKVLGYPEPLTGSYKSMFQKLPDIREVLTCKIEELGSELKEHYKIEAFTPVLVTAQEPVTLLGQIGCDSNGKLNHKSVILEGDREHSSGAQIPVDLSELKEYSLFPGQVVVMEGINTTGRKLVATRLYERPLIRILTIFSFLDSEQIMVLVACGPYTTSDSITFDPLLDLITIINRDQPDVCILCSAYIFGESCLLTSPFEDVFKQCLRTIIEGTRSSGSHLIFVPSLRDVHHEPVYPQPPFSCSDLPREDKKRVQFVSEPCTLSINGMIFGLTSTDLLLHMGAEEISSSSGTSDRFSRILKHILTQRSYYPLYPPQEAMAIDYENFYAYAQLPVTPDVFIAPSELRYFVKVGLNSTISQKHQNQSQKTNVSKTRSYPLRHRGVQESFRQE
ncbi:hypothetical protein EI555_000821 [Monodon monoceros]|uniref:DNA polymerase alpha subunit B n=1 Tax=Monodon monoceros TaxID=40151 RepID=A0A4U1EIY4_MONMO|nr:hypothetical protein EI555_000821 [Monodon monoceros]